MQNVMSVLSKKDEMIVKFVYTNLKTIALI